MSNSSLSSPRRRRLASLVLLASLAFLTLFQPGAGSVAQAQSTRAVPAKAQPRKLTLRGGGNYSLAIVADGSLLSFSPAQNGQSASSQAIAGVSGVPVGLGVGGQHGLVVTADGSLWSFGDNTWGQLGPRLNGGDGTLPAKVEGLNGIVAAAAGTAHSVALAGDGTVWTWGQNSSGQLGNGTLSQRVDAPAQVPGLSGVVAVAAGDAYTLALKADGTVWAWGANGQGQLGNGQTDPFVLQPVPVSLPADTVALAAGGAHSLALQGDGTVWAWGANGRGQLGDGTTQMRAAPGAVAGLGNVLAVAVGHGHSLALNADGTVSAWGANGQGQLGSGDTLDHFAPVPVTGLGKVDRIGAGASHSLAGRSADGAIWMWGGRRPSVPATGAAASKTTAATAASSLLAKQAGGTAPAGMAPAQAKPKTRASVSPAAAASPAAATPRQVIAFMQFAGQWPLSTDNYNPSDLANILLGITLPGQNSFVAAIDKTAVYTQTPSNHAAGGIYMAASRSSGVALHTKDGLLNVGTEYALTLSTDGNYQWRYIIGRVSGRDAGSNPSGLRANLLIYSSGKGYFLTNDIGGVWEEGKYQPASGFNAGGVDSFSYSDPTTQQLVAGNFGNVPAIYPSARLWATDFTFGPAATSITQGQDAKNLVAVPLTVGPDTLPYSQIKVRFDYAGTQTYSDGAATLRLWRISDPNGTRDATTYVVPGQVYTAAQLGLQSGQASVSLYAEGVSATAGTDVTATFIFNGNTTAQTVDTDYFHDKATFAVVGPQHAAFPLNDDDVAGQRYRKVALNGRPLPDSKPQGRAESDEQSEESFIDALDLTLHHDTTDVYVPLPGGQLALTVRRSATLEVWNARTGLRPEERPDRPFGLGWTSNLGANIRFVLQTPNAFKQDIDADYAFVTDEQGASYRFVILYDQKNSGARTFFPLPRAQHDQDGYDVSLTASGTTYTFTRKYGTTLSFSEVSALTRTLAGDRINPSATPLQETDKFARLDAVQDRFGTRLAYTYTDATSPPDSFEHPSFEQRHGPPIPDRIQRQRPGRFGYGPPGQHV